MNAGNCVKCLSFISDFNENQQVSINCSENPKSEISRISVRWESVLCVFHALGQNFTAFFLLYWRFSHQCWWLVFWHRTPGRFGCMYRCTERRIPEALNIECSPFIVRNRISQSYKTTAGISFFHFNLYFLKQRIAKQSCSQITAAGSSRQQVAVLQLHN